MVRSRLDAASWSTRDNVAQSLISDASIDDLHDLDAEGVLLLAVALQQGPRILSARDEAALVRLRSGTQYKEIIESLKFAVTLVKGATTNPTVTALLDTGMVERIYAAENSRLSIAERIGIDGSTIGRGQLGNPAFTDVKTEFASGWRTVAKRVATSRYLFDFAGTPRLLSHGSTDLDFDVSYSGVYSYTAIEDFVVAAYLAVLMTRRSKPGRSHADTAKFAVAFYHGMSAMVIAAQSPLTDKVNWAPVEAGLLAAGNTDEVAYVNEVVR
jgi:hypothetical protein